MTELLRQFETLTEPVTSPSGEWALRYNDEGRAEISDRNGTATWTAGAAGTLALEPEGVFAVREGDQVVWRADLPKLRYSAMGVTDDGDGVIYHHGLPKYSLRHGPIEAVSPGDRAPLAEIHGSRFLEPGDGQGWLATLQVADAYCVTVIHDVDPDEALRRFGAEDKEISTATWAQLGRRASYEETDSVSMVVAAFALGRHTLLVEDNGWEAIGRPDLSRGTFAVTSYLGGHGVHQFLVSRDGETLANFMDYVASEADGAEPGVLTEALARMGIGDIEEFDSDDANLLDDLELLCQLTGVWPEVADVTGPARVAILHRTVQQRLQDA
ncbi:DUF6461 domain-containing protein [Amycolatopsis minnesotensis]|uniref:Uncharacterized protein n=1 Tax=Amycolatopsis minnesotensis TaxID=337894 RepID=A0ABN2QX48_9PSEU